MKLTGYSLAARSSAVSQLNILMMPEAKKISASVSRISTSTLGHTKPCKIRRLRSEKTLVYRINAVDGMGASFASVAAEDLQ